MTHPLHVEDTILCYCLKGVCNACRCSTTGSWCTTSCHKGKRNQSCRNQPPVPVPLQLPPPAQNQYVPAPLQLPPPAQNQYVPVPLRLPLPPARNQYVRRFSIMLLISVIIFWILCAGVACVLADDLTKLEDDPTILTTASTVSTASFVSSLFSPSVIIGISSVSFVHIQRPNL